MTYTICIKETLERLVEVDAADEEEAIEKVREQYDNSDVVLDYNDFVSVDFEIS